MNFEFTLLANRGCRRRRPRRTVSAGRLTWFLLNLRRISLTCVYVPSHGARVVSLHSGLGGLGDVLCYFQPPEVIVVKKRVIVPTGPDSSAALVNRVTVIWEKLPHLVEHLAVNRYEDGETRTPGTMLLKSLGTAWVVVLKEPDSCLQMQTTAATLDDALVLADLLLGSDGAPWEPDPWAKARAGSKKK